ncbi:RING-H2 finger protein ATL1 [Forsythia ovata]|uniref:RING-type E3 ubiquitin transferase n=1 Tax=Forsythia ovata TaxID=205694 RepID=A0ABD1T6S1_9LAMI
MCDCVDIWLQSNANCPLCRYAISGRNRYQLNRIVAPNSSPQDPLPFSIVGSEEDFVVIELNRQQEISGLSRNLVQSNRTHSSRKFEHKIGKSKSRKFHHVSIMGDEGVDVRKKKR